jgi:hypothetical protein
MLLISVMQVDKNRAHKKTGLWQPNIFSVFLVPVPDKFLPQ